ncbi:MAG: ECF transporter S component [Clostridiales bacterium]|nr:ECF transporter S component [Clostridiales bacterium]MDD6873537.1 ECF transporter S component [Clostridiales bacterium]MDD7367729.1 ECF transporter S component [Clostridiales bacterium]
MTRKTVSAKLIARVGVLGAIAALLFLIPGIPIVPPIYKLDFSTVPVLLGGFSLGPVPGLLILLVKDLVGLTNSSSMGVGELADFLASAAMMLTAVAIYRRHHSRRGALIGLIAGTAVMTAAAALINYYIVIPFYVAAMNMPAEAIVSMIGKVIPAVDSLPKLIAFATTPFNLLKGVVLSVITFLLYKRLSPLLKGEKKR